MHLERKKVAAIAAGKAHALCDFSTAPDVTAVRITNLDATHTLELFTKEAAEVGKNCHIVGSGGTHFIELPVRGESLFGASGTEATEVEVEIIGVVGNLPNIVTG